MKPVAPVLLGLLFLSSVRADSVPQEQAYGKKIQKVTVVGAARGIQDLPLKAGDVLSEKNLSAAFAAVRQQAHDNSKNNDGFFLATTGGYRISCDKDIPSQIDVTFYLYSVGLKNTLSPSAIVPMPQIGGIFDPPSELDYLNPKVSLARDKTYGFSQDTSISSFWDPANHKFLREEQGGALHMALEGRNSFEHGYYDAKADVDWITPSTPAGDWTDDLLLNGGFASLKDPLGSGYTQSTGGKFSSSGQIDLSAPKAYRNQQVPFALDSLNFGVTFAGKSVRTVQSKTIDTNDFAGNFVGQLSFLLEDHPGELTTWIHPAMTTQSDAFYGEGVARFHYAGAVHTGPAQYIRFDSALTGGGTAGAAPNYALFYAGNTLTNADVSSADLPTPIIRSLGSNSAGVYSPAGATSGASSFANLNSVVAFPIHWLSAPLIPQEQVGDGALPEGVYNTIVNSTEQPYDTPRYENGVNFLCYDADLYSLKPVLLLDTAWLGAPSGFSDRTVASVGGGLEATIVVVNFDVIYAHTVYDSSNQNTNGNLIFQLSYQKIF